LNSLSNGEKSRNKSNKSCFQNQVENITDQESGERSLQPKEYEEQKSPNQNAYANF
jgi:hypothetical protein